MHFWFKYDLGQKYYTPKFGPTGPPGHDSTFHATEKPAVSVNQLGFEPTSP